MNPALRDTLWDERARALIDDEGGARLYEHPMGAIEAWSAREVPGAFAAMEGALASGYHLAGALSYELGYALEPKLARLLPEPGATPLLSFGVFAAPEHLASAAVEAWLARHSRADGVPEIDAAALDEASYAELFARVQELINAGETYQINLTFPLRVAFHGDPLALYRRLRRTARVSHGAVLALADRHILSLSPELFLDCDGTTLKTRPMKGTARRAPTLAADQLVREALQRDEKSRAENLMIVDLLRNDLGRIATPSSVRVTALHEIETYPTLHQMTSTIEARLKPGTGIADILAALFPCGSVTGAPKIHSMEIIHGLEAAPRGLYCGAIGWLAPRNAEGLAPFRFNVAIRTLDLARIGTGTLGVGSGLVADSDAASEYAECLLKARFLAEAEPFALFETLLWERGTGFALCDEHLDRLESSARYFGFPFSAASARDVLDAAAVSFAETPARVRLTLADDGAVEIVVAPAPQAAHHPWRVALSPTPVDSGDVFLFHKTTRRGFYDREQARLGALLDADEVLFANERGELTEGSRTNLFVKLKEADETLVTPPLACGLLPGVLRHTLLRGRRCVEALLRPKDIEHAAAIYVGNSVRGLIPCVWVKA